MPRNSLPRYNSILADAPKALAVLTPLAEEMQECQTFIQQDPDAFHCWLLCQALLLQSQNSALLEESRQAMNEALRDGEVESAAKYAEIHAAREKNCLTFLRFMQSVNSQRLAYTAAMAKLDSSHKPSRSFDDQNPLQRLRLLRLQEEEAS